MVVQDLMMEYPIDFPGDAIPKDQPGKTVQMCA
jgi:hypothetical protein